MQATPREEHAWLERLVGRWTIESEMILGPGQTPETGRGTEVVRSLGGLWVLGEGEGAMPGGGVMRSVMTLGFDPRAGRFVGTFVASVMDYLWIYRQGRLDAESRVLTLDAEGPDFTGETTAQYQDLIEVVDDDHRVLRSQVLGEDGRWVPFLTAYYHRQA